MMMNSPFNKTITHKNTLISLLIIILIWLLNLSIGLFLTWIFNGERILLRTILIQPFVVSSIYGTIIIWKY